MPILILTDADAGLTIPVTGSATWTIFGTDAADNIEVAAGTSATVNGGGGIDNIHFLGDRADYTVALVGTSAVFTHTNGSTVTVPITASGDSVKFVDGTTVTLSGSATDPIVLGNQTLTTTPAPVTGNASGNGTVVGQSFTLTESAGVYTFANGSSDITVDITENVATFTRGGDVAVNTIDFGAWVPGDNFINLASGQNLVLTPAQATAITVASTVEPYMYTSIYGNGSVEINTATIESDTILYSIASDVTLSFAGASTVTVNTGASLDLQAHHADSLIIEGEGRVGIGLLSQSTDAATLDIRTAATESANFISGTGGDDVISVTGTGFNYILASKGADQITLGNGTGEDYIFVEGGTNQPTTAAGDTPADVGVGAKTTYTDIQGAMTTNDTVVFTYNSEAYTATLSNGTTDLQTDINTALTNGSGNNGDVLASFDGTNLVLTAAGDITTDTLAGGDFTDVDGVLPSDSAPGYGGVAHTIDDITFFDLATDKLDLAGGTGVQANGTFDVSGTNITILNGVVTGTDQTDGNVLVTELLTLLDNTTDSVAFRSPTGTYVLQGDGVAGGQLTDIIVHLIGVEITDLSTILA